MDIPRSRLDLEEEGTVDVMGVKCGPHMVGSLLAQDGGLPAYHMSKGTWISVLLDGTVPDEPIFPLLELSYDNAAPKRKRPRSEQRLSAVAHHRPALSDAFLIAVHLPAKQGEPQREQVDRIFAALNENHTFKEKLCSFIMEQLEHIA